MKGYKWFPIVAAAAFLGVFFLINGSCFAEKAPYTSFAIDATSAPPKSYYDYIIIGGGTAGCALAATLSASAKVLVLERGGLPYDKPNVININGTLSTLLDMSPSSASQVFISTDGVFGHRGRSLGGTSAINAGFYSRASHEQVQDAGWDPVLVNESYVWVEDKVVFKPSASGWQGAVRDGLIEGAGVLPDNGFTYEHLQGTKTGGSTFDENGHRHTAADLLEYADATNIVVYLHAVVHQILFTTSSELERPKAYGVFFRDSNGTSHEAYLNSGPNNEIIVSAGALGSPQLLMLSGIGPALQLWALGINVVLDQTLVGQGMGDNPMNIILNPSPRPVEISNPQIVGISDVGSYIEAASLYFDLQMVENFAKSTNQSTQPLMTILEAMRRLYPYPFPNTYVGMIAGKVADAFSTGFLVLQSKDPNDNPVVTFNYFHDLRDLQRCVQVMGIVKRVIESRPLSTFRYPFTSFQSLTSLMLFLPLNLRRTYTTSTTTMEQFCIETVMSIWHYHGGCQVGRVVDHDYRVIGVDSLRVIDASTFNTSPGTNPQATIMMLGRYMGQKILGERVTK